MEGNLVASFENGTVQKILKAPKEIYLSVDEGILKADENRLGRTLIPFYRHHYYSLDKKEFRKYRDTIRSFFNE